MKINPYLKRISINNMHQNNLETLSYLQLQHMCHVPFENLDVIRHVPIPLDVETYYKKIVLNHRGGFCYELNGLFNWLLKSLGFTTHLISATVHQSGDSWAKEGSHATQIVELDQPYLVDVGFGDSVRQPLPLTGEMREDISGVYRTVKVMDNIFDLQRKDHTGEWLILYRFDIRPKQLTDFTKSCHFNQTSATSHFTQESITTIATDDGRITLSGNDLTITRHGEKKKTRIRPDEKSSVLKKYFNIHLEHAD